MVCKVHELGSLKEYKYVVVLSEYNGKILLSRHKDRTTWETQGGHIEEGETPLEAAKRELYEESGALEFEIEPLCDYWSGRETNDKGGIGMVFHAKIAKLGEIPESEMAEVKTFDKLPDNLTYPWISPVLFRYLEKAKEEL
ncbi:MAG: NUDIX domain-containing protein [Clostridia bacterium]|nr:NUDIX domain-containing protein [Clostridia bacterium]